jgi:hypothetical protein
LPSLPSPTVGATNPVTTGVSLPPVSGIENTSPALPVVPRNDVMYSFLPMIAIPMMSVWGLNVWNGFAKPLQAALDVQLHFGNP